MLTAGLSVVEQICVCDEGVMGLHNDRRTDTKMPTTGSFAVLFLKIDNVLSIYNANNVKVYEPVFPPKVTLVSHILAAFCLVRQSCTSSTLLPHKTKIDSRYATLPSTFIIKQFKFRKFNLLISDCKIERYESSVQTG